MSLHRLGWAVSGRGAILQGILEAQRSGLLGSRTGLIICDRESEIEDHAKFHSIPLKRIDPISLEDKADFQKQVGEALSVHGIDWLGLTFNRLLAREIIDDMGGRIFNIHFARLPAFPGFFPIRRAIQAGALVTGATIHLVDSGIDTGPIIAQASCPVASDDTEKLLGRRLFELILPLTIQVVREIENGALILDDERRPAWDDRTRIHKSGAYFPAPDRDVLEFAEAFCARLSVSL